MDATDPYIEESEDYLANVVPCEGCGERWCEVCGEHWADCGCPGPHDEEGPPPEEEEGPQGPVPNHRPDHTQEGLLS